MKSRNLILLVLVLFVFSSIAAGKPKPVLTGITASCLEKYVIGGKVSFENPTGKDTNVKYKIVLIYKDPWGYKEKGLTKQYQFFVSGKRANLPYSFDISSLPKGVNLITVKVTSAGISQNDTVSTPCFPQKKRICIWNPYQKKCWWVKVHK